ncbi:hypothetical protein [Candidatus Hodarchaeum mangrovi]
MSQIKTAGILISLLMLFSGFILLILNPSSQFGDISLFFGLSLSILVSNALQRDL